MPCETGATLPAPSLLSAKSAAEAGRGLDFENGGKVKVPLSVGRVPLQNARRGLQLLDLIPWRGGHPRPRC